MVSRHLDSLELAGHPPAPPHHPPREPERSRCRGPAPAAPDVGPGRRPASRVGCAPGRARRQAARDHQPVVRAPGAHASAGGLPVAPSAHRDRPADLGPCGRSGQRTHRSGRAHHQPARRRRGGATPGHVPVCFVRSPGLPGNPRHTHHTGRIAWAQLHHARLRHTRRVPAGACGPRDHSSCARQPVKQRDCRGEASRHRGRRHRHAADLLRGRRTPARHTGAGATGLRARDAGHPRGVPVSTAPAPAAEAAGRFPGRTLRWRASRPGTGRSS
jgi:hypothetical protein